MVGLAIEIVGLLLSIAAGIFAYWRFKQWSDTAESLRDPAFEYDVHIDVLREDEQLLENIRESVEAVGLHRLPHSSGGRYGGASMRVTYAAFVIDTNGETHDVAESEDWADVENDAEWLANALDVPLKDETYG